MQDYIIPILTLLAGGGFGWLLTIKATKKKADAEAMASVQDVYQQTIDDLNKYCNDLRTDRNNLRADRDEMRRKNKELEEKVQAQQDEILEVKKEMSRLRREVDSLRPFLCSRPNCDKRMSMDFCKEGQPC